MTMSLYTHKYLSYTYIGTHIHKQHVYHTGLNLCMDYVVQIVSKMLRLMMPKMCWVVCRIIWNTEHMYTGLYYLHAWSLGERKIIQSPLPTKHKQSTYYRLDVRMYQPNHPFRLHFLSFLPRTFLLLLHPIILYMFSPSRTTCMYVQTYERILLSAL